MSSTKIKRGKQASPRRKPTKRRTIKKTSIFDRMLAVLPFTQEQIRRAMTIAILGVVGLGAYSVASITGMTDKAYAKYAETAANAGFEVRQIEVRGLENVNELKVYEIVLAEKDRSMPLVDLKALRNELVQFGWIADARISRQLPDRLIVDIVEHNPHALWQNGDTLALIDKEGRVLEKLSKGHGFDLPLIRGEYANENIAALDAIMGEAPALTALVEEAEWVGRRRWDVTFDSGEKLALPEGADAAKAAYVNFARMEGVNRLLGKGVTFFDLRDPEKGYFRLPRAQQDNDKDSAGDTAQSGKEGAQ
jgi:cell division protein FtsQ